MCSLLEVQVCHGGQRTFSCTYMNVNLITPLASRFPDQLLSRQGMDLLVGGERWVMLEEEDGQSPIRMLKRVLGCFWGQCCREGGSCYSNVNTLTTLSRVIPVPKKGMTTFLFFPTSFLGFLVRRLSIAKQNFAKLFTLLYEKIDSGIDPWIIACS